MTDQAIATGGPNVAYRNATVVANGINFTYREAGDGPLMLLLHGFPDNATTWNPHLEAFAAAVPHRRALPPRMPGPPPSQSTATTTWCR